MDKIVLKTFTSNSRKLSCQKFHDLLTARKQECRDKTAICNYHAAVQPSNNKFIDAILGGGGGGGGGGVRLTCPDCKGDFRNSSVFHI